MQKFRIKKLSELDQVSDYILENLKSSCLALEGDLGTGKTTLTQNLAKKLGVKERVNSPTFVILKEYEATDPKFKKLLHMDAYRLEGKEDIRAFEIDKIIKEKNSLLIIEWPEKLGKLECPSVKIKYLSESEREILINF